MEDTANTPDLGASLSTRLDEGSNIPAGGAGVPSLKAETGPEDVRASIEAAMKEADAKPAEQPKQEEVEPEATEDAKDDAKAQTEDKADQQAEKKPEAKSDAPKPVKVEKPGPAPEDAEGKEDKQSEARDKPRSSDDDDEWETDKSGRRYRKYQPPERFGPDSKELWKNVPRAVKRDISIFAREVENEKAQYREAFERYQSIRDYDELARQNGRDLRYSLERVKTIEDTLQVNPLAGLDLVLREVGPRKADGSPISLYELAEYIVQQGPEQYRLLASQGVPPPPHPSETQAHELQERNAQLQKRLMEVEVIAPFRQSHPRYDELQGEIAKILQSGIIRSDLSPHERLELAYAYAERLYPPLDAGDDEAQNGGLAQTARAVGQDFGGNKSLKPSIGSVSEVSNADERPKDIRDILEDELRKRKRA